MDTDKEVVELAAPVRDSGMVARLPNGQKISMVNACNLCGFSLDWCKHETPIVFGQEVTISNV